MTTKCNDQQLGAFPQISQMSMSGAYVKLV